MLDSLGSLSTLTVNFPDDEKLMKAYGPYSHVSSVTHVCNIDTVEERQRVVKALENHAKQINSEYTSVRVAAPVVLGSGEIATLFKVYGMNVGG